MDSLDSLVAFKVARQVSRAAYRLTLSGPLTRHYPLSDQIRRAAVSIPANICEGYALGTKAQLIRHVRIAYGSARELKEHLLFASDLGLVSNPRALPIMRGLDRLIGLLIGLLKNLGARLGS